MSKYVSYCGDSEVIVCVLEDEHRVIKDFFSPGDRNIEDYNREESNEPVYYKCDLRLG